MKKILLLIMSLSLVACGATSPSSTIKDDLANKVGNIPTQYANAATVEEIRNLKPQATMPLKIAVLPPKRGFRESVTIEEREIIQSWESQLKDIGFVESLTIIPQSLIPANCNRSEKSSCFIDASRAAAARLQADAILFLNDTTLTDQYSNALSILNWTIIGMWIVPAHHRDSYTIYEASLLDVDNGYLYAVADASGTHKELKPFAYTDYDDGKHEARVQALKKLGERLISMAKAEVEKLNNSNKLTAN